MGARKKKDLTFSRSLEPKDLPEWMRDDRNMGLENVTPDMVPWMAEIEGGEFVARAPEPLLDSPLDSLLLAIIDANPPDGGGTTDENSRERLSSARRALFGPRLGRKAIPDKDDLVLLNAAWLIYSEIVGGKSYGSIPVAPIIRRCAVEIGGYEGYEVVRTEDSPSSVVRRLTTRLEQNLEDYFSRVSNEEEVREQIAGLEKIAAQLEVDVNLERLAPRIRMKG